MSAPKKSTATKAKAPARKAAVKKAKASPKRPPWRPTKYKTEFCQAIVDYFSEWEIVERIEDRTAGGGTSTHFETVRVPSIYGFAAKIGVNQDTLREWAKIHKDFSVAFTRAQAIEDSIVHEYGMAGRLHGGLAALYFTNRLGYKNKTENDVTVRTEEPILGGDTQLDPDDVPTDDSTAEDQETS